jgi:molecular chaperone DnaJ
MAKRKRDYYAVLGVPRDASENDIKRTFRELARKHHPDVNPADGGERFRELNEAYTVLSDRESRARYDRWGHADSESSGLSAVVDAAQQMINDVLRGRKSKQKGKDIRYTLELTFEEAAFGASKTITLPDRREYTVVVSPGTKDGTIKTGKGEGERNANGAGDLHILVRVAEHASFRRDGNDVNSTRTVSFAQAALGAVVDVDTLDGAVKMRIPEGTQPGAVFRIRNRGIPQSAGKTSPRGDHLVTVQVEVPTGLTARQRELIEELGKTTGETAVAPKRQRLLDRVRSLLDD